LDDIPPGYVAVGRVLGAWGARGDLKIQPLAPQSALVTGRSVSVAGREYIIERSDPSGRFVRLKITGVDTREDAQLLRGAYLQTREGDLKSLPEGEYYRFQLVGLAVHSIDGRELGRVVDVLSTPENDVYVVKGSYGEVLIPAVDDVVREIDLNKRLISVEIIPGLLP
jgi:16S rRNA processing protein RimM